MRVSVQHLPLTVAQVCPGVFITPTNSSFFPLLPSALEEINSRVIKEVSVDLSILFYVEAVVLSLDHNYYDVTWLQGRDVS